MSLFFDMLMYDVCHGTYQDNNLMPDKGLIKWLIDHITSIHVGLWKWTIAARFRHKEFRWKRVKHSLVHNDIQNSFDYFSITPARSIYVKVMTLKKSFPFCEIKGIEGYDCYEKSWLAFLKCTKCVAPCMHARSLIPVSSVILCYLKRNAYIG